MITNWKVRALKSEAEVARLRAELNKCKAYAEWQRTMHMHYLKRCQELDPPDNYGNR